VGPSPTIASISTEFLRPRPTNEQSPPKEPGSHGDKLCLLARIFKSVAGGRLGGSGGNPPQGYAPARIFACGKSLIEAKSDRNDPGWGGGVVDGSCSKPKAIAFCLRPCILEQRSHYVNGHTKKRSQIPAAPILPSSFPLRKPTQI